jgi:hypothetical protein
VAGAGDVNSDGFDDLLIGAYRRTHAGMANSGRVFLHLGSAAGLSSTIAWGFSAPQAGAETGFDVDAAGDLDGDGYGDVIVSAYRFSSPDAEEGKAYVFFGSAGGISTRPPVTWEGDQADALFPDSVGPAGDVNGDGRADLVMGTSLYDSGDEDEGIMMVYLSVCGTSDADGDGLSAAADPECAAGDVVDCLDSDGSIWSAPGMVADLRLAQTGPETSLSWTPPAARGSTSLVYDVLRAQILPPGRPSSTWCGRRTRVPAAVPRATLRTGTRARLAPVRRLFLGGASARGRGRAGQDAGCGGTAWRTS